MRENLLMDDYKDLLHSVLTFGEDVAPQDERTGTGTKSLFGHTGVYDLRLGFPLTTLRPIFWRGVVGELLWFMSGSTDVADLRRRGVHFWDPWVRTDKQGKEETDLGWVYGYYWRRMLPNTIHDPLYTVVESLKKRRNNRRLLVCAWDHFKATEQAKESKAPPPCHVMMQFSATPSGFLDLQMIQRSADCVVGVPYNIASYALLLSIVADMTHYTPRFLRHVVGDAHIYNNHLTGECGDVLLNMLAASEREAPTLVLPQGLDTLTVDEVADLDPASFRLDNYNPYKEHEVKWPVAV